MATFQSIVIHSRQPLSLRSWYRELVGGHLHQDFALMVGGTPVLFIEHDSIEPTSSQPDRTMINFQVEDLDAERARLDDLGVTWIARPAAVPFGKLATIADPDGNYVQLVQCDVDPFDE